jgi:hypothetical protein
MPLKIGVRAPDSLAHMAFFILALLTLSWVCYDGLWGQLVTYGAGSDIWEHVAVLKAWSQNILHPSHPQVNVDVGSPRYSPLYLCYAIIVAATGLPPLQMIGWIGIVHFILLLVGLRWFALAYYRSVWAPVITLIVMLTFWGIGWGWSNAYGLRSLILVAPYPSIGVFGLSFILFGFALRLIRQPQELSNLQGAAFCGLVFVIILSHLLTAIFAGVFGLSLLFFEKSTNPRNKRKIFCWAAVAFALALLWPWYSLGGVLFSNDLALQANWLKAESFPELDRIARLNSTGRTKYFYDTDQLVLRAGVGLVGFLFLPVAWKFLPRYRAIVMMAGVFIGLLMINAVLPIALGHRYLFFALVAAHLCLVAVFVEAIRVQNAVVRFFGIALVSLVLVVFGIQKVSKTYHQYMQSVVISFDRDASESPVVRRNKALAEHLSEESIVATDLTTAFSLAAFIGKVMIPKRGHYFIKDRSQRKKDLRIILDPETDDLLRRVLLDRYGVTDLIVTKHNRSPELETFCHKESEAVVIVGDDQVCKLRQS